jgi:spermidine synthase
MMPESPVTDTGTGVEAPLALSRARTVLWLLTVTCTGGVIMGLELLGFRLYAPHFGYSIYVWGSMIAVIMAALAGGYALGGWLADRSRSDTLLYIMILSSGIYQLFIVYTAGYFLRLLENAGVFTGTIVASFIIFVPPMIALAGTSPFVVRLLARAGRVGSSAGRVYALSTVGCIVGVLGTTYYLIPVWGTHATLQILCAISVGIGVAGLAARRHAVLFGVLILILLAAAPKEELRFFEIWRAESVYNEVHVIHYAGYRWLTLNDLRNAHTTFKDDSVWSGSYLDVFVLGPVLVHQTHLLVLGMGAGGSIRMTRLVDPNAQVDAVEIDPLVIDAAQRFFGLPTRASWLRVHLADARPWLAHHHATHNLVHVDLYQGSPYIPFYLTTEEFFRLVRAHLSPDGLLMMNVYDCGPDRELLFSVGATLQRVFPTVLVYSRLPESFMLFAFPERRPLASVRAELARAQGDPGVVGMAQAAASGISELQTPPGTLVFTDDHAPIEPMTRRMLAHAFQ